jgi:hypothetical protein
VYSCDQLEKPCVLLLWLACRASPAGVRRAVHRAAVLVLACGARAEAGSQSEAHDS